MAIDLAGLFTGDPARRAAEDTLANLDRTRAQAMGALSAGSTQGVQTLKDYSSAALGAVAPAYERARGDITGATGQAIGALEGARGAYDPLAEIGRAHV